MNFLEPEIAFDPNKPFYGLIVAYLVQFHGLLDLAARGLREEWENLKKEHQHNELSEEQLVDMLCSGVIDGYADHCKAVITSESAPLPGVQKLGVKSGGGVKVLTNKLAQAVFHQHGDSVAALAAMSSCSVIILAWESTLGDHTKNPLWEFLRHCRNAAAHRAGRFNFLHNEPRRAARWRSLEIRSNLNGSLLFGDSQEEGFIGPGDVLYLLADIERKFY